MRLSHLNSLERNRIWPDNTYMNTTTEFSDEVLDDPVLFEADAQAVRRFLKTGEPADEVVKARIWARVNRERERNFQRIGYINTAQFLLPSTVDDE